MARRGHACVRACVWKRMDKGDGEREREGSTGENLFRFVETRLSDSVC